MIPRIGILALAASLVLAGAPAIATPTFWVGNDTGGAAYHIDMFGNILGTSATTVVTGVAFNGTNLFTQNGGNTLTVLDATGGSILDSFTTTPTGLPTEDLAWDSTRGHLWSINHSFGGVSGIQEIDVATETTVNTFTITTITGFSNPGALGLAYDPTRDLLYASFCHAGCSDLVSGIVIAVDPDDGSFTTLFQTTGFATGGLAYDPLTDTLWVGDSGVIRNMSLSGSVLNVLTRPAGSVFGFADGLEIVQAPEPGVLLILASGLTALALARLRRDGA
jgi:hypothetical protein